MSYATKLKLCFGSLGAAFGLCVLAILIQWIEPEAFGLVLLVPFEIGLFFPGVAIICAILAVRGYCSSSVGAVEGARIALLAYAYFVLFHTAVATLYGIVHFKEALVLLLTPLGVMSVYVWGTLLFGIPLVLTGAVGGAVFKRYIS